MVWADGRAAAGWWGCRSAALCLHRLPGSRRWSKCIVGQNIGYPAGVGLDPLEHGQQMRRIAGPIVDANGHERLVVTFHGGLDVAALDPAVSAFEDVAVGIGEVRLRLRLRLAGYISGERALRHRQSFTLFRDECCFQACG
jgi:hypothetical protein